MDGRGPGGGLGSQGVQDAGHVRRQLAAGVLAPGELVQQGLLALPWGGTSHPVWFRRDPRMANVKVLGGVFNRALMQGVPQLVSARRPRRTRSPPGCAPSQLTSLLLKRCFTVPPVRAARANDVVNRVKARA